MGHQEDWVVQQAQGIRHEGMLQHGVHQGVTSCYKEEMSRHRDMFAQLSEELSRYILESSNVPETPPAPPPPEDTSEPPDPSEYIKPRKRGECLQGENAQRPCPFVSCKHHLYLDVSPTGLITINSTVPVEQMENSCALDVADTKEPTLKEIGAMFNVTRERIRQIEAKGLRKLRGMSPKRRLELLDSLPEDPPVRPGAPTQPKPTLR